MKPIKIYKAFHTYSEYLDSFYLKNPELIIKTFEEQKSQLIKDSFPWIFSWSNIKSNKNIEIFETVHNCEPLQKGWLDSQNINNNWQEAIVYEQIKKIQPNICVLYPPQFFNKTKIEIIRSLVKHDLLMVGYDGMDRQNSQLYEGYDLIITCSKYISKFYADNGLNTYTLNFCFDPTILNRIQLIPNPQYDVSFTGSIYPNVHLSRYDFLKYLTRRKKVEIRSNFGKDIDYSLFSKYQLKLLLKTRNLNNYFSSWRIGKYNQGSLFGLDMYQFLNNSKISLNMHGDKINFSANVRMYEITGVGSCLLTDWKENISEIFVPDKECVTYNSKEEAVDKIKYLLKNENIRKKIAQAGQQRTLNEYTYEKCLPIFFDFLQNMLK